MKKINLILIVAIAMTMFTSCENNEDVISKKDLTVVDFLDLYGKSKEEIRDRAKKFYIKEDNYDDDGELYWVIQTNKSNYKLMIGASEYFVSIKFNGNYCNDVGMLNRDSDSDYTALDDLIQRYGNDYKKQEYWWYVWYLKDGSQVTYFGYKSLLIYRKDKSSDKTPKLELQQRIKVIETLE